MTSELWSKENVQEADLCEVANDIVAQLNAAAPYIVWLDGPMGAGKTTLTRALLRALGLPEAEPVTSPTYTLMNEYRIGGQWYAHLDLYRAGPSFSLMELGVLDARPFRGIFVEWAQAPHADEQLECTHRLSIEVTSPTTRTFRLSTIAGV
jgi:tRNA threonylcarbamoyl adenosine modification protein YjeE